MVQASLARLLHFFLSGPGLLRGKHTGIIFDPRIVSFIFNNRLNTFFASLGVNFFHFVVSIHRPLARALARAVA